MNLSNSDPTKAANLSNLNLSNTDFSGVNLTGVNLSGTNLSNAQFSSTTIFSDGAIGANLSNIANLSQAANLSNLDLSNTDFRGVNLSGVNLSNTDLSNAQFDNNTFFTWANLSNSDPTKAANLSNLNFSHSDFTGTNLAGVNLSNTDLSSATFDSTTIFSDGVIGVNLSNSDPSKAANLFDIDLSNIILTGVNLTGVKYNANTVWPSGFNPISANAILIQSNLPPTDLNSTAPLTIAENQPIGSIVGEFNATDPDINASLTYSLVTGAGDGNNSLFTLETNGTLKTASILDYEKGPSLSIRVQVKDEHNASMAGAFNVTVTDANDWALGTVSISGNAQVGQTLTASDNLTDQDGLGTIMYLWERDGMPSHGGYIKDGINGVDGLNAANRMTISPDNKHVYVTAINDRAITWHEINATTGALTYLGYVKDGVDGVDGLRGARDVAISTDGKHVYAVAAADDGISWYDRNATTGALTFRSFLKDNQNGMDGLNGAQALVISPDGKNIYIAGREENSVTWVDRNTSTGEITFNGFLKNNTSGVSKLNFPVSIDISSDSKHVYLIGRDDNAITWFERNATSGDLIFSGYVQNGSNGINNLLSPENLVLTSGGDYLYVSSPDANATLCFSRNPATGALTYLSSATDGIGGVSGIKGAYFLSLSPDEKHLYVSAKTDYSIAWFDRNVTNGALIYGGKLTYNSTHYIPTKDPTGAQVSSDGKTFYQLGGSSDDIVWMSRNPVTGALLYQKSGPTYDVTHGDINKRISVVAKYTDGSGNLHLKSSADTQQVQPPVYTALTNANFQTAINLWFSDKPSAILTYGHISDWNVSAVTDMNQKFKGSHQISMKT